MKNIPPHPQIEPGDWRRLIEIVRDVSEAVALAASGNLINSKRVTGTYTLAPGETYIGVTPSGACTITLPAAKLTKDVPIIVARENNTTHTITVAGASGNINGAANITLTTAYQVRRFVSDGANYFTG